MRPETTAESLSKLRPAFDKNGTVTAGNASQISDGGAAVIVMSKAKADQLGLSPLGELVSYGQVAGPIPPCSTSRPMPPRWPWGRRADHRDIDMFEINEAFAAVGCASADDLGITEEMVNVNGGRSPWAPGGHVRHPGGPDRSARAQAPGWGTAAVACAVAAVRVTPPSFAPSDPALSTSRASCPLRPCRPEGVHDNLLGWHDHHDEP